MLRIHAEKELVYMDQEKEKRVTLSSFPKKVRPAVRLLGEVAEKALQGVGLHGYGNCPLTRAYAVYTPPWWRKFLDTDSSDCRAKEILTQAGWNESIYDEFMNWYDKMSGTMLVYSKERENLLRAYLERRARKNARKRKGK